jgi:molybdopterin converting factor small subunit
MFDLFLTKLIHTLMATVIIPTPLRKFTGNAAKFDIKASNVEDALNNLSADFPELKRHLLDDQGKIRTFLNIFVGDEDIRDLQNAQTPLHSGAVLSIVPAIAGGSI